MNPFANFPEIKLRALKKELTGYLDSSNDCDPSIILSLGQINMVLGCDDYDNYDIAD